MPDYRIMTLTILPSEKSLRCSSGKRCDNSNLDCTCAGKKACLSAVFVSVLW
jgi:hypothetical protein